MLKVTPGDWKQSLTDAETRVLAYEQNRHDKGLDILDPLMIRLSDILNAYDEYIGELSDS